MSKQFYCQHNKQNTYFLMIRFHNLSQLKNVYPSPAQVPGTICICKCPKAKGLCSPKLPYAGGHWTGNDIGWGAVGTGSGPNKICELMRDFSRQRQRKKGMPGKRHRIYEGWRPLDRPPGGGRGGFPSITV